MLQSKTKPNTMPDNPSTAGKWNKPKKAAPKATTQMGAKKAIKTNEQIGRVISIKDGIASSQD